MKLLATLVALMLLTACGTTRTVTLEDGTEISESGYIALQSSEDKKEANKENISMLMEGVKDCSTLTTKDERAECQHSNQLWMGQVPWLAQAMNNGGVDPGYWNLANAREQRRDPIRYINAATQVLQSLCITGLAPWSCASGGGGDTYNVKADRGGTIDGTKIFGRRATGVWGDDANIAQDDSQAMRDADGSFQSRSTTRPFFQPEPQLGGGSGDNSPGGSLGNESEGLGASFQPSP